MRRKFDVIWPGLLHSYDQTTSSKHFCVNPLARLQKKAPRSLLLVKVEDPPMPLVICTSNESLFAFELCLMSILTCLDLACSYLSVASDLKHLVSPSSKILDDLGFSLSQTDGPFKSLTIRHFCQPSHCFL